MATATRWVTLDRANPNFAFIREFGSDFSPTGLWRTLGDFRCGPFESSRFVEWFWKRSQTWRPFSNQASFTAYARERLSDEVGYTRKRLDAENVVSRYFDKGDDLTFDDVMEAVTFCDPTQPMPLAVYENSTAAIVDVTKRAGDDKFLKVERDFLPTLIRLYPWERRESSIIKSIPVGSMTREFDLVTLAFWSRHMTAGRDELAEAISFHSADKLDWTSGNLYSRWREGFLAEKFKSRVDPVLDSCVPVKATLDGHRRTYEDSHDTTPGNQVRVMPLLGNTPSKD